MRPSLLAITAIMLGAFTSGTVAFATGNVLLPADNNSTPNLGLAPAAPPASAPATSGAPNKDMPAPLPEVVEPEAKTVAPVAEPAALPFTPVPEMNTNALVGMGMNGSPTTVIKQPDSSAVPPMPAIQLPPNISAKDAKAITDAMNSMNKTSHLSVNLSPKSMWSPQDLEAVTERLGIPQAKVPSSCHMSIGGMLLTSGEPVIFKSGISSRTEVGYNGALSTARIHIQALCNLVPLPPNKGVVIQIGDKYAVELGGMECGAPAGNAHTLTVLYSGGTSGKCQFN